MTVFDKVKTMTIDEFAEWLLTEIYDCDYCDVEKCIVYERWQCGQAKKKYLMSEYMEEV